MGFLTVWTGFSVTRFPVGASGVPATELPERDASLSGERRVDVEELA